MGKSAAKNMAKNMGRENRNLMTKVFGMIRITRSGIPPQCLIAKT
jgi:hypothetical protein